MMKFEYQFDDNHPKTLMELSSESELTEVLEAFERFLRVAGYVFNGIIDIVPEESEEVINETN